MAVMSRGTSRRGKGRRSSFVASGQRAAVVPDALSWREQLDAAPAPKGPAAWAAASNTQSGRTVIDAGPYGMIDLAATDAASDGREHELGVVWWDRRSYRPEDHDDETIQTSFVPAPISTHVSLSSAGQPPTPIGHAPVPAPPSAPASRSFLDTVYGDGGAPGSAGAGAPAPKTPAHGPSASMAKELRPRKGREKRPRSRPTPTPMPISTTPSPSPSPSPEVIAVPVSASRPAEVARGERRAGHVRRSRHVALVPKRAGMARELGSTRPRRARLRRRRTRRRIVIGAILVVVAFVTTFLIQSAIITPFTVPSASMENTLHVGDRIVVNRAAYNFSDMRRGDVVVFSDPGGWLADGDRQTAAARDDYLVKRIIGLPGDHVSCCGTNGKVVVNGVEVDEPHVMVPEGSDAANGFDVTVPSGSLWVLGDNRFRSRDSSQVQDLPSKGFVPLKNVIGQAVLKVWPLTDIAQVASAREAFAAVPDPTCPM